MKMYRIVSTDKKSIRKKSHFADQMSTGLQVANLKIVHCVRN